MFLAACQLSRDVIGDEDSLSHWCVSIRLLSQLNSGLYISQILCCPVILSLFGLLNWVRQYCEVVCTVPVTGDYVTVEFVLS